MFLILVSVLLVGSTAATLERNEPSPAMVYVCSTPDSPVTYYQNSEPVWPLSTRNEVLDYFDFNHIHFTYNINFNQHINFSVNSVTATFFDIDNKTNVAELIPDRVVDITSRSTSFSFSLGPCATLNSSVTSDAVHFYVQAAIANNTVIGTVNEDKLYINAETLLDTPRQLILFPGQYSYLTVPISVKSIPKLAAYSLGFNITLEFQCLYNISIFEAIQEIIVGNSKFCPETNNENSTITNKFWTKITDFNNSTIIIKSSNGNCSANTGSYKECTIITISKIGYFPPIDQYIHIAILTRSNATFILYPQNIGQCCPKTDQICETYDPLIYDDEETFPQYMVSVSLVPMSDVVFQTYDIVLAVILIGISIGLAAATAVCSKKMTKDDLYNPVLSDEN